jgi:hypothetical protein
MTRVNHGSVGDENWATWIKIPLFGNYRLEHRKDALANMSFQSTRHAVRFERNGLINATFHTRHRHVETYQGNRESAEYVDA